MLKTLVLRCAMVVPVLLGLLGITAGAQAADSKYHHLHHAIHELKEAKKELIESKHDYGGHRAEAVRAVDAALIHMDTLLVAVGEKPVSINVDPDWYKGYPHHPHMHHAVHELREAHKQIKEAKTDFGGHREEALKGINYAVEQIELALKFHDGKVAASKYHHLHHAIHELKEAKKEMLESKHDFGGHRVAAVQAVDAAITQIDILLIAIGEKPVSPAVDVDRYKAYDHHPHMQHAVHELHEAHKQIKEAKIDFDGHKDAAMKGIDFAAEQVAEALKFHDGKKKK